MKKSFSLETKEELCTHVSKNKCCNRAELCGIFLFARRSGDRYSIRCDHEDLFKRITEHLVLSPKKVGQIIYDGKTISAPKDLIGETSVDAVRAQRLLCNGCFSAFMRGVFLVRGRVTDPGKAYHMELVFKNEDERDALAALMADFGQEMKTSHRKTDFLLYRKGSESIEDFLAFIGSNKILFEFMNRKIVKEFRNNANRAANCDAGNIRKSLEASGRQVSAVRSLISSGKIETLSEELKATAYLRLQYESLSLEDLAQKTSPPISKSGLNHRLEKIIRIAEEQ